MDKTCGTCRFQNGGCRFPEAQDGAPSPFMISAACPNEANDGRYCMQHAAHQPKDQPHD